MSARGSGAAAVSGNNSSSTMQRSPSTSALQAVLTSSVSDSEGSEESSEFSADTWTTTTSYDPLEGEVFDALEKWRLFLGTATYSALSSADRTAFDTAYKDTEQFFRKFHGSSHGTDLENMEVLDATTLESLTKQLKLKLTALNHLGNSLAGASLRPRTFRSVFDMEAFFRQSRPILPEAYDTPDSGQQHVSASPRIAKVTAIAPSSPSTSRKPPKTDSAPATTTKRSKLTDSASGLREQVARRAKRKQSVLDRGRGAVTIRKARYHIVVDISEVHVWLGQEATLAMCLYSLTEDRIVSEEVAFPLPNASPLIAPGKARVTFLDVPIGSIEDLHLICRISRIGKLKYDYAKAQQLAASAAGVLASSPTTVAAASASLVATLPTSVAPASGISSSDVKRPFAVATLALSDAVEVEDATPTKSSIHLFTPTDECEFSKAHQYIIHEDKDHPLTLIKAKGLVLTLRQVSGAFPGIEVSQPNLKRHGLGLVAKPLELRDGETRHDLYITIEEGHFSGDAVKGSRDPNVELILEPCSSDGRLLAGCAPHKSCVYYHSASPAWNETFKIDLARHKDLQSVSVVARQVTETGKFIDIGTVKLVTHNPDGSLLSNGSRTLNLPSKGSSVSLSSLIVSSKYSANVPLMSLLNWKTSSSSISEVLVKCTLLEKTELIKFHREIIDSLLEIMELLPDVSALAFSTLVAILASASDGSQQGEENDPLQRCVDHFISTAFTNPRAHFVLMDQLTNLCSNITRSSESARSSQRALAMCLKALSYLFQLIVRSRLEWQKKRSDGRPSVASVFQAPKSNEAGALVSDSSSLQLDEEFKSELGRCLLSLASIGAKDEAQLVGLQTKLIRTFPSALTVLDQVFSKNEIRCILEHFLDNLSAETSSLGVDKLLLIEAYMDSTLPIHVVLRHLKSHLRRSKEEKLHCIRLIGLIVKGATETRRDAQADSVVVQPSSSSIPRSGSFGSTSSAPAPVGPSPASGSLGSGRIKIKQRTNLDSFRSDSGAADPSEKVQEKKHKLKDKSKEKEPDKPDKPTVKKSGRSDSGAQPVVVEADESKDYESSLRDKLLAGRQKRTISPIDADSLPHRYAITTPHLSLWALLLDAVPALTRVLCSDMSASALGATGDDDYSSGSARTSSSLLSASAAMDLSSRLELMTVITGILNMISPPQIRAYFAHIKGSGAETKLLKSLIEGCLEMVGRLGADQFNFPTSWPDLLYSQISVIIRVIKWLRCPILGLQDDEHAQREQRILTEEQLRLWCRYLRLIGATLLHRSLQLESYASRSSAVGERFFCKGLEARHYLLRVFVSMWKEFEPYHIMLVPDLTVYLIAMAISVEKTGRISRVGQTCYCSLLERDAGLADGTLFTRVEVRTIQALEELSRSALWNEVALRRFFDADLKVAIKNRRSVKDPVFGSRLADFTSDMLSLLNLLTELRGLPSGAEYEEERAFALTQLMTYLRQTQHGDAYVKYAHKLSRMYEEAEQFVEAGFAVMQHANSLDWTSKMLPPVLHYPSQMSRERKMLLLRQSLALFERGRAYEQAIDVLQQMVAADSSVLFDYYRLGANLRLQADFYEKILEEERFFSNYFFVYYFGTGFPKALRKKTFIYRGLQLERIPNFIQRMSKKFPAAEIVKSTEPVTDHDRPGQFLQVFSVLPSTEQEMFGHERPAQQDVPERILKYQQANEVKVFHYSRPFRKDPASKKEDNEFASLWIAKTFCVVSEAFPNVQRRLEVVDRRELVLSPIENAVAAVTAKNAELRDLISKFSSSDNVMKIDRLSMALQGVLDAAVNGGTAKYQSAFMTKEFGKANPDKTPFIVKLEEELKLQVQVLGRGLTLHGDLVPDALQGLHGHLETQYTKLADQMKVDARQYYRAPRKVVSVPLQPGVIGGVVKSSSRPQLNMGNTE